MFALLGISLALSSISYAESMLCLSQATRTAKINLFLKARNMGFLKGGNLDENVISIKKDGKSAKYQFSGSIYKGNYLLDVKVDSLCSLESLVIQDVEDVAK